MRSLRLLRDTQACLTGQDVAEEIKENLVCVETALEQLMSRNIIVKLGDFYSYQRTPINEEFCQKVLAVYDRVTKKAERESLIVGILSATVQHRLALRHKMMQETLQDEGFESEGVDDFLEESIELENIGKIRIAYISREMVILPVPPSIPLYYMSHLQPLEQDEYEKLKRDSIDSGFFIQEEQYLVGNYPPHIAYPARERLNMERGYIRDRLAEQMASFRQEALGFWNTFRPVLPRWSLSHPEWPFFSCMTNAAQDQTR